MPVFPPTFLIIPYYNIYVISIYLLYIYDMKMNRDKPCHNSFCEPAATERRSKKSSRIALMHTESLTRIFLTFVF